MTHYFIIAYSKDYAEVHALEAVEEEEAKVKFTKEMLPLMHDFDFFDVIELFEEKDVHVYYAGTSIINI